MSELKNSKIHSSGMKMWPFKGFDNASWLLDVKLSHSLTCIL